MVWRALVPVPPLTWKFWNENIVGGNKHAAPLGMLLFPRSVLDAAQASARPADVRDRVDGIAHVRVR
jgi:hypothetical protein